MSPRSAYTNRLRRARTRERIVTAATRLFAQYGFTGTTTRMLARTAGISEGLIYAHFRSNGEILEDIIDRTMTAIEASFDSAEAASPSDERLERLMFATFALLQEQLDFWRISYAVRMQPPRVQELGDQRGEWDAGIRMTIARYLHDAGAAAPQVDAHVLFALLDGVSQHYAQQPDLYPLGAVTARIIDLYRRLRPAPVPWVAHTRGR